jgi:hypothetical protein
MFSAKKHHYELGEWVDFVRGLVGSKTREKMQAHLDSHCRQCADLAGFFFEVAQRATADAAYNVPDYAERNLRAIYALQRPEEVRLLPRTIARLVYDSFREPLPAGVRSQRHTAHQLMYEAGPYCVDLRLEHEQGSPNVRLIGQIANREHGAVGVPDVPVFLLSRNLVVNKTETNRFGEFAMQYMGRNGLRLFAPIPGENHIEIRLSAARPQQEGVTS